MKNFYLITNPGKDPDHIYTDKICSLLDQKGCRYVMAKDGTDVPEDTDFILVLGGDGTMLRAARETMLLEIPILGINLGTLGYLTEVEFGQCEEAIDQLLAGDYIVEKRMMLQGTVYQGDSVLRDVSLNDVVVTRNGKLQILVFDIYVNQNPLCGYQADGVLVATPTGSTGYNLSAGGPIVEPGAKMLLMTPICPHTIGTRSIVLAPGDEITISIPFGHNGVNQTVDVHFDGNEPIALSSGDKIEVSRSEQETPIIKLHKESFLQTLHQKMSGS